MGVRIPASLQEHQWVLRFLPFLNWAPRVTRANFESDLFAALTGAIVVLPQGVAFAYIAGMPPEYGLYAGIVPAIIAALFGSSWHLVSGPTTAASVVLFSSLSSLAVPGTSEYITLALTLAFLVGAIQLIMGIAHLGALVNFISHSVVIGFTAGAALLIMFNQLRSLTALEIPRGSHPHETLQFIADNWQDVYWPSVIVGVLTLATGLLIKRFYPRMPYMIIAIFAGALVAWIFNANGAHVATVGALPASLPPLSAPSFSYEVWRDLAPTVVAVTLFALTEALSISRALAIRSGQQIDPSQEFIGQGLSNIVGSFFSAYVATGSFNRSGLNYDAGAKTPLAAIMAGFMLAGIVLFVAPYARYLPNAAMAGVLFIVAIGLLDFYHARQILRTSKNEAVVLAVTFFSAIMLDLEFAIFAGVLLSLLLFLHRTANPVMLIRVPNANSPGRKFETLRPGMRECKQVRIVRFDGPLFFGAASTFTEKLTGLERRSPNIKHLAIVMNGVNYIDVTGAEALIYMAERYRAAGGGLYLIRPPEPVMKRLKKGGYLDEIGEENVFTSKTDALRTIYRKLDYGLCQDCNRNVFVECRRKGKQEPREEDFDDVPEAAGQSGPPEGSVAPA